MLGRLFASPSPSRKKPPPAEVVDSTASDPSQLRTPALERDRVRRMYWPNPLYAADARDLYAELPDGPPHHIVHRHTPLGSAGSCFAVEIAHNLQARGFRYVITERDGRKNGTPADSCALWGTLFNAPAFRQLVERAYGVIELPRLVRKTTLSGTTVYMDAFRHGPYWDSLEAWERNYEHHVAKAREALDQCEVFILTLGMNEVWHSRDGQYYFPVSPWDFQEVQNSVLTVEENLQHLDRMVAVWRNHNPRIRFIVSVSPVPLQATFRSEECSVITANCHSKSTLRVVAEAFVKRHPEVYYMPSFESVLYCTKEPWTADQRHVSKEAIAKVMDLFNCMFVADS
jgi:hypothetical protein